MGYLSNASDINQVFVIEPLSVTGGTPTLSACTSIYTNEILSCSGDTVIFLGSGVIDINGSIYTNNNLSASTINGTTYYSGGTDLLSIINYGNINNIGFSDNQLSITTNDNSIYSTFIDNFTGITVNGGINANSLSATTLYGDGSNLTAVPFWTNGSSGNYSLKAKNQSAIDAQGNYSFAVGFDTKALGDYSHAEGYGTTAIGTSNHSEGYNTVANSSYSHAEGWYTIAFGEGSHAEGGQTTASGKYSHAGGTGSSVTGDYSFIHSTNSTLSGKRSVLLGGKNLNGNTDDTVYVPYLNISSAYTGTSIAALGIDANGFVVTGVTISNYLSLSGGTLTGTLYGTAISANTISATTFYGNGSNLTNIQDTFVTGGTYNSNTGVATFRNNTGGTFTVTGFSTTTSFTGGTVTGATIFSGGLSANTISATTYVNLPVTADTFTTAFTYSNNVFTINRNQGQSALTATINTMTGLTVNGSTALNGSISSTNLSGSTDRVVQVDSSGSVSASLNIITAYISSGSTAASLLTDSNNWNIYGVYTGTTITGTYAGQKHYDDNYFYEAVQDNVFIRLIRG